MSHSYLTNLQCSRCDLTYDADRPQGTCSCGAPLLARYDLERLARAAPNPPFDDRGPTLWRYRELLPVRSEANVVSLGEGMTPIVELPRLGEQLHLTRLSMKDEGLLPTGTFKARGAAVGVSRARELGIRRIAMPTNGNAGAAWATYAARAGMEALIAMPLDAPKITRAECFITGARLHLVDGLIGDAARVIAAAVASDGYFDVSTLKEPYRLEGKKTMGLELFEQLQWRVPDVILYPTGGGVGIIGIYKALRECQALGWLGPKLPRLVAVQAAGCAPIVKAWEEGRETSEPWVDAATIAFGITVPKALGDFLVLRAVRETGGCAVAVTDTRLLEAQALLAHLEGEFVCPEGAACVAAAEQLALQGWLKPDDHAVIFNTGMGLKYPGTVRVDPAGIAASRVSEKPPGTERASLREAATSR